MLRFFGVQGASIGPDQYAPQLLPVLSLRRHCSLFRTESAFHNPKFGVYLEHVGIDGLLYNSDQEPPISAAGRRRRTATS